jgi:predicted PurR-regulated permease PerM
VTQKTTTTVVRPNGGKTKASSQVKVKTVVASTLSATPGDGSVRLRWKPPTTNVSGIDRVRAQVDKWLTGHRKIGPFSLPSNFEAITTQYGDQVTQGMKTYASHIGEIIVSSASRLITIILVPIIIFYVLSDIDRLRGRFLFLLPEASRAGVARSAEDVGNVFGSYVRGMLLVSSIYGITAMVVFAYWLKSYSLLLGVAAGILYIVPFIGPMVTALLTAVLSIISGLSPAVTLWLLALCLAQNQIFDNLVVPRVIGHSVGLHPLLTLFALFLGGEMFGIWGMLLSVPIAASIQVTLFRLFPKFAAPTPLAMLLGRDRPTRKSDEETPLPQPE